MTISDDQARWCLENNKKIKIYENIIIPNKDAIINTQGTLIILRDKQVEDLKIVIKNDSTIHRNDSTFVISKNNELVKEVNKTKTYKIVVIAVVVLSVLEKIALAALFL